MHLTYSFVGEGYVKTNKYTTRAADIQSKRVIAFLQALMCCRSLFRPLRLWHVEKLGHLTKSVLCFAIIAKIVCHVMAEGNILLRAKKASHLISAKLWMEMQSVNKVNLKRGSMH